jgi:hypothetical protein
MADHLTPGTISALTAENLKSAYDQIFGLLDKHRLPATFATVSVFGEGREVLEAALPALRESAAHRAWLEPALASLDRVEGWFMPELAPRVAASGVHEWATHGFCHVPFDHPLMDESGRCLELSSVATHRLASTPAPSVMVYPRNRVVQPELLAGYGITAHRVAPRLGGAGRLWKAARIAAEFNRFSRSDRAQPPDRRHLIPGGQPLNWRAGVRAKVPIGQTVARWRAMVHHALKTDGVVHVYLHPHNLITGDREVELFDAVLAQLADSRDRGLTAMTLGEYAAAAQPVVQHDAR